MRGEKNIRYYLGDILLNSSRKRSRQRLQDIEAAIIFFHSNAEGIVEFNIQSTSSYSGRDLEIINRGNIPPQISNFQVIDYEFGYL